MEDQELENEYIARGLMPDIPLEEAVDMLTTDALRKRTSVADDLNQVTADGVQINQDKKYKHTRSTTREYIKHTPKEESHWFRRCLSPDRRHAMFPHNK